MILTASFTLSRRISKLPAFCPKLFSTSLTLPKSRLPPVRSTPAVTATSYDVPTKSLLSSVEKIIRFAPASTDSFIQRRLKEKRFKISNRCALFERLISLLIHHRHFTEAGGMYAQLLKEGYVSSLKTDAQMLAIGLVLSPHQYSEVIPSLRLIFASKEYGESDFILLLGVFQDLDAPPKLMIQVIQEFVQARGENYTPPRRLLNVLAGMLVKEGQIQEAFALIDDHDSPEVSRGARRSHPYASIISSLDAFDPLSQQSIGKVLATIREKEIEYDASIFNSLISHQVRLKDADKAFTIYKSLMDAAEQGFTSPDHYTFRNLFRIFSHLKPSSAIPMSPRNLFRDMVNTVFAHHEGRKVGCSIHYGHSLMVQSLQAFLARRDYAAAYCVTKFLVMTGLPVSAQVYNAVIYTIAYRTQEDIAQAPKTGGSSWMHRLLGHSRSDFEEMKTLQNHQTIVSEILRQSKTSGVLLDSALAPLPLRGQRRYMIPSIPMMKDRGGAHLRLLFDVIPLQRVLRRAILAHIEQENDIMIGGAVEARRATGELIAAAEAEMIPETIELNKFDPAEFYMQRA